MAFRELLLLSAALLCYCAGWRRKDDQRWNGGFQGSASRSTDQDGTYQEQPKIYATCVMRPDPNANYTVTGTVDFAQPVLWDEPLGPLEVRVNLRGFPSSDVIVDHGLHVHTYGTIGQGCSEAGGHYNPYNTVHGGRNSAVRHVGDFGNVREDSQGRIITQFKDPMATLAGDHSILGRAVVIHANRDDLGLGGNEGSLASGNSGARVACCSIVHSAGPK